MKKTLLSLSAVICTAAAWSQVIVAGVSPANIVASYEFGVQTHEGWPGQTGDGSWNMTLDFNIPGTYVEDTLMLVDDGSAGTNAQGHPIAQEGCGTLVNDLTGKIAVIYRNTCDFGTKVLNAQNAGAVAAIIVNREPVANFNMLGGTDGPSVTIPAVFLSSTDGETLINEMANGPVVVFIGNKIGAFTNDVGSDKGAALISPYGGAHVEQYNGFTPGIEIYNWGVNAQGAVNVNAKITGPSGIVYDETVGPLSMASGDTISIFAGNPNEFPPFDLGGIGNYPVGDYTLVYNIDLGITDDSDFDNEFTSMFTVNNEVISLSTLNAGMPVATNYPSNATTEYQSCMFYEEQSTVQGFMPIDGVYFVAYTDTATTPLAGEEIFINVYEWNDTWVDLTDPGPQTNNDWFTALLQVGFGTYYPASNNEAGQPVFASIPVINLQDNQRYLICLQTFNTEVAFGYDNILNYDANQAITAMPISPVYVDGTWYTGGWTGTSATSIALHYAIGGIEESTSISGMAFPNPALDVVTISVEANGDADVIITDVSGKVAMTNQVTFENGLSEVNIASLEPGVYVFNVAFENGLSSRFNVVKK